MRSSRARTSTSPVGTLALIVSLERRSTCAEDGDDEFRTQALRPLEQVGVAFDDHLRVAVPIAQVEENERAEVANAMHPAEQGDICADVGGAKATTGVRA